MASNYVNYTNRSVKIREFVSIFLTTYKDHHINFLCNTPKPLHAIHIRIWHWSN